MRQAALLVALAGAGPAAALTPAPACGWDAEAQQFAEAGGAPAYVRPVGKEFAESEWYDETSTWRLLQHCPTGQYLLARAPEGIDGEILDRWTALIETTVPVTLRQMGEDLAALGAGVRLGEGDLGDCACAAVGM